MQENGRVSFFDSRKGFGFIVPDSGNGPSIFVHVTSTVDGQPLVVGDRVTFLVRNGRRGKPEATGVRVLEA
jgi:cold shock CspA family protein